MIHGAVDGFFLLITGQKQYIAFFQNAVGLPKTVRTDGGSENADVWAHMTQHRANSRSVIVCSSVHNVFIEQL